MQYTEKHILSCIRWIAAYKTKGENNFGSLKYHIFQIIPVLASHWVHSFIHLYCSQCLSICVWLLELLKFYSRLTNGVLLPQVNAHLNVRGQTAVKSSPAQTSSRATTARTQVRSASPAPCVTSASWGATTWRNMPAATQASTPACCRAPVWPRGAAAPCPCLPLTLETRVL